MSKGFVLQDSLRGALKPMVDPLPVTPTLQRRRPPAEGHQRDGRRSPGLVTSLHGPICNKVCGHREDIPSLAGASRQPPVPHARPWEVTVSSPTLASPSLTTDSSQAARR